MLEIGQQPPRYTFFLDPDDCALFPVCPLCDGLAPLTSFGLVVAFPVGEPLILHFDCRYCDACDLVIIGQDDLEKRMAEELAARQPELIGQEYRFLGTLDMADLERSLRRPFSATWLAKRLHTFIAEWEHCFDDEEEPEKASSRRPILLIPPGPG